MTTEAHAGEILTALADRTFYANCRAEDFIDGVHPYGPDFVPVDPNFKQRSFWDPARPILIETADGRFVDRVSNWETAESVMWGDLSTRPAVGYVAYIPDWPEFDWAITYLTGQCRLQADCWGFDRLDAIRRVPGIVH